MMAARGRQPRRWRLLLPAVPWTWMALFFLVPLLVVLAISFSEAQLAIPPYAQPVRFVDGQWRFHVTADSYAALSGDGLYLRAWLNSLYMALVSTALCLLLAWPMAWAIARTAPGLRGLLLLLVVIPSWTSFLIRAYAWLGLLGSNGHVNAVLLFLGVVDGPVTLLRTPFAVYVGIVYSYLPFMILPLYAGMVRLDYRLVEAARDLGAGPLRCFTAVILPLSRPALVAGALLVFIPVTGEFVIPELLGGADTLVIGKVLWQEFFHNRDWPLAAALATLLLATLLLPIVLYCRSQLPRERQATALAPSPEA